MYAMEKKIYGVFRVQKIKVSNGGGLKKRLQHSTREIIKDNIDTTRLCQNEYFGAQNYAEAKEKIIELWQKADNRRSDNVGVLETIITTTGKLPQGEEKDFIEKSVNRLKKMYGENLVAYMIHRDEKETHIHAFSVPLETKITEKKHLSAEELSQVKILCEKRGIKFLNVPKKPKKDAGPQKWQEYKKNKKAYDKFKKEVKPILEELGFSKTQTALSCQSVCGSAYALSTQQDLWFEEVFQHFGLERGEKKKRNEKEKYIGPTSLKQWQNNLEAKEKDLDTKEQIFFSREEKIQTKEEELENKEEALIKEYKAKFEELKKIYKDLKEELKEIIKERERILNEREKIVNKNFKLIAEAAEAAAKTVEGTKNLSHEQLDAATRKLATAYHLRHVQSQQKTKNHDNSRGFSM